MGWCHTVLACRKWADICPAGAADTIVLTSRTPPPYQLRTQSRLESEELIPAGISSLQAASSFLHPPYPEVRRRLKNMSVHTLYCHFWPN